MVFICYWHIISNLIIQWGTSKGSAQIVFPITYNSYYSVTGITVTTVGGTGNTGIISVYKNSVSSCYMYVRNISVDNPYTTDNLFWMAIGT